MPHYKGMSKPRSWWDSEDVIGPPGAREHSIPWNGRFIRRTLIKYLHNEKGVAHSVVIVKRLGWFIKLLWETEARRRQLGLLAIAEQY